MRARGARPVHVLGHEPADRVHRNRRAGGDAAESFPAKQLRPGMGRGFLHGTEYGEIQADGQFETVWQTPGLVAGDEWSDFLPDSKDLISDWRKPMSCGNFNVATGKCGGKG